MRGLTPLLAWLRGTSDLALALAALGAVALLVTPLPPWVLDLCIAANLALAATILVVALLARDALRFASFPTLLLFTTLFRLAIAVSATRLVLSRGDAGRVIQAFGQVVVAGSYVVGVVVFAILTLAQLLVVTKGAERVAEVAARFTLDALPGKQMSIDADLRAGAIDTIEARRRRRALEREGQLYGAMDGALKFVKGDAVAGIVIVLVNVAGGLVAGLGHGLTLTAAARRYAMLAIGDGLVEQIPALLISVAAGVVVTRVASDEDGHGLSADLGRELLADARVPTAVAILCGALALLPGLPVAPFAALGLAAGASAYLLARRHARTSSSDPVSSAGSGGRRPAAALPSASTPLALELAPDLATLAGTDGDRFGREMLAAIRSEVGRDLGVNLPEIAVRPQQLPPGCWRLLLDDVPAAGGRAPPSEAVALAPAAELDAVGIRAVAEIEPLTGLTVACIAAADARRAEALAPVRGPLERIGAALSAALRTHAHLLFGIQEVQELLETLEGSHPALVREVARQISTPVMAEVMRRLLEEGIPVRPLQLILEALLEAGGASRGTEALAEAARRALRRHIAHRYAGAGALEALLLDPAVEAALRDSLCGSGLALEPETLRALLDQLGTQLMRRGESRPPVLLSASDVRRSLRQLVSTRFPKVAVLSYEDLPANQPVRPVGKLSPVLALPSRGEA